MLLPGVCIQSFVWKISQFPLTPRASSWHEAARSFISSQLSTLPLPLWQDYSSGVCYTSILSFP